MMYRLEQRIYTLARNFVGLESMSASEFTVDGVTFTRWPHPVNETWTNKYWLATAEVEAGKYREAWQSVWDRLARSVPRLCTVSQCYTEHLSQPLLILRRDLNLAFVRWTEQRGGTGLMFTESELKALNALMNNPRIPDEFFWYWNDATNSTGYASKVMLMLSAVETLVNKPSSNGRPQKDYVKLESILGPELKKEFWGEERKDNTDAVRHSLAHGRYFPPGAGRTDYLLVLHQKIITYLNDVILGEKLIEEDIVHPQRHPTDNMDESQFFVRARGTGPLSLVDVAADMERNFENPQHYEYISANEIPENF